MNRHALLLFFLSGATSLIYEVLWMRRLSLIFGHSILSVSTVLTTFMAGLALGSYLGGRWSDRVRKQGRTPGQFLKNYGTLELLIGGWALLTIPLLHAVEGLYLALARSGQEELLLQAALFLAAFAVLLPPTTAMGATLPIYTQTLIGSREETGRWLSVIYGLNTIGACVGAATGGLVLLPVLGLFRSIVLTAALNLAIAITAWLWAPKLRNHEPRRPPDERVDAEPRPEDEAARGSLLLPLVFGLSGLTGMIYQIGWTRALILSIGSSTYSFTLILVSFLAALALGSFIYNRLFRPRSPRLTDLALIQLVIGFSALLVTWGMGWLPVLKIYLKDLSGSSFATVALLDTLIVFLVIAVPTIALGLTFPLVTHLYTTRLEELGRKLGEAYAANTLGAIAGSFGTGFILLPLLGLENSIRLAALCNLIGAALLLLGFRKSIPSGLLQRQGLLALGLIALLLFGPKWDLGVVSSGTGIGYQGHRLLPPPVFYRDGVSSTVSVGLHQGIYPYLSVNGKIDASMSRGDRRTQLLLGLLPAALHPQPEEVALIGFGSGQTAAALLSVNEVKSLRCAELEPAVLEAKPYFEVFAQGYFEDPRLQLVVEDGRRFILGSPHSFDLIVSEPSNPWIAGVGNLYTVDFYRACRAHLKDGGLMAQWFHLYAVTPRELRLVLRTFYTVFPEGALYQTSGGDILLIGSEEPVFLETERLEQLYGPDSPAAYWFHLLDLFAPEMLRGSYLTSREGVMTFLEETSEAGEAGQLNTDDLPRLEFMAPLNLHRIDSRIDFLHRTFPELVPPQLQERPEALMWAGLGRLWLELSFQREALLERLRRLEPTGEGWIPNLMEMLLDPQIDSYDMQLLQDQAEQGRPWLRLLLLDMLAERPDLGVDLELYDAALKEALPGSSYHLALAAGREADRQGLTERARSYYRQAIPLSSDPEPLFLLSTLGEVEEWSLDDLREAIRRNPYNSTYRDHLAELLYHTGEVEAAWEETQESYRLFPFSPRNLRLAIDLAKQRNDAPNALLFSSELRSVLAMLRLEQGEEELDPLRGNPYR